MSSYLDPVYIFHDSRSTSFNLDSTWNLLEVCDCLWSGVGNFLIFLSHNKYYLPKKIDIVTLGYLPAYIMILFFLNSASSEGRFHLRGKLVNANALIINQVELRKKPPKNNNNLISFRFLKSDFFSQFCNILIFVYEIVM